MLDFVLLINGNEFEQNQNNKSKMVCESLIKALPYQIFILLSSGKYILSPGCTLNAW